jgi:hypothetical protein
MKVLFYAAHEKGVTSEILKWAQSVVPSEHFGICRSFQALEGKLRQQNTRCCLAILHINAVEEMDHLIHLKNLLDDIRIILIVPEVNEDTTQKGYQLYPRFMTDSNIDMNHLAAVIKKNLEYLNIKQSAIICENCHKKPALSKRKKR